MMALFKSVVVLLAVALLLVIPEVNCCEKITFTASTVAASLSPRATEEDVLPISILNGCLEPGNGLDEAVRIAVVNSSVPILYPEAVKDLTKLEILNLDFDGIKDISPGAFVNLPSLKALTLIGNKIKLLGKGIFNGLNISYLNLNNNSISSIAPGTFDDMPKLMSLDMEFNKMSFFSPSWFTNTQNIVRLSFAHNKITTLPAGAFATIKVEGFYEEAPSPTIIDFSFNKIATLDPLAFEGLGKVGLLNLRKNSIKALLPNTFSSLSQIGSLILDENKIDCLTDDFLNTLPPTNYISANGNSWNCTCLESAKSWFKLHGGLLNVQADDMSCTMKKMKGILDFVQNIKDMKTKFATMKFGALADPTSGQTTTP